MHGSSLKKVDSSVKDHVENVVDVRDPVGSGASEGVADSDSGIVTEFRPRLDDGADDDGAVVGQLVSAESILSVSDGSDVEPEGNIASLT